MKSHAAALGSHLQWRWVPPAFRKQHRISNYFVLFKVCLAQVIKEFRSVLVSDSWEEHKRAQQSRTTKVTMVEAGSRTFPSGIDISEAQAAPNFITRRMGVPITHAHVMQHCFSYLHLSLSFRPGSPGAWDQLTRPCSIFCSWQLPCLCVNLSWALPQAESLSLSELKFGTHSWILV